MTQRALLQRKCSCGRPIVAGGECASCRKTKAAARGLTINRPGDRFEQQANRAADLAMSGKAVSGLFHSAPQASLQREEKDEPKKPPKPNNYDEAAKKIGDALQETAVGKQLKGKAEELGKDFLSSVEGKVIAGTALGGALTAIIASNSALPVPIPEVPLDFIKPGLKAKLVYEGPTQKPTNVSITLTSAGGASFTAGYSKTAATGSKPEETKVGLGISIPLGPSPKKKKDAASNSYAAETARLRAEQNAWQNATKTDAERKEEQEALNRYLRAKANELSGKKDDLLLMRSANAEAAPATAPPIVHDVLARGGQPLDPSTRGFMEARFGHDFSQVRIHHDTEAAASADAVHAAAYTVGDQIVFGAGRYQPDSMDGRRLLAHELAHTLQQNGSQLRRYAVPADLACSEVVPWLNANSPYAPEWAETRCNYSFNGGARVALTNLPGGTVRADVRGSPSATVTHSCPIDRPQWSPSARTNRAAEVAAWSAMRASLDAHESAHRTIGTTWKGTLQTRFRAVNFSVTGNTRTEAMANATAEIQSQQTQWQADAQAAQDAIDPFRGAVLTCP